MFSSIDFKINKSRQEQSIIPKERELIGSSQRTERRALYLVKLGCISAGRINRKSSNPEEKRARTIQAGKLERSVALSIEHLYRSVKSTPINQHSQLQRKPALSTPISNSDQDSHSLETDTQSIKSSSR